MYVSTERKSGASAGARVGLELQRVLKTRALGSGTHTPGTCEYVVHVRTYVCHVSYSSMYLPL